MSKRIADTQITSDFPEEQDDNADNNQATRASAQVMARRKIITPRGGLSNGSNPFKGKLSGSNGFKGANTNTAPESVPDSDKNNKIRALNEKFISKLNEANVVNTVVDFTAAAKKYIEYYLQIESSSSGLPAIPKSAAIPVKPFSFPSSKPTAPESVTFPSANKPLFSAPNTSVPSALPKAPAPVPVSNAAKRAKPDSESDSDLEDDIKVEGPKFTLNSQPTVKNSPFSFGAKPAKKKVDSDSDSESEIEIKGPIFSFNKPIKDSVFKLNAEVPKAAPFSFGNAEKKDETEKKEPVTKLAFSFGNSTNTTATSKPFTFGAPASSISSTVTTATTNVNSNPTFNFNTTSSTTSEKPAVTFGTSSSTEKPTISFGTTEKPSVSFGSASTTETPKFAFGSSTTSEKPAINFETASTGEKPSPSFDSANGTEAPKLSFNFGATTQTNKKQDEKPAFTFGSTTAPFGAVKKSDGENKVNSSDLSKNASGVTNTDNSVNENDKQDKPAFSFDPPQSTAPATLDAAKPFSFGSVKPFSFQAQNNASTDGSSKPFSFGSTEKNDDDAPKPFSFGSNPSKPFSFGSADTSSKPFSSTEKKDETPKPFSFGAASNGTDASKPFAFGGSTNAFGGAPAGTNLFNSSTTSSATPTADKEENGVPEEETGGDFEPVTKLTSEKIESPSTGEEDEEVLYGKRTKLMLFNPENKDQPYANKGLGELKVLKNKSTQKSRILVRADGGLRVLLNTAVSTDFTYSTIGNGSMVRIPTINPSDKKLETFVLKVKTPADGEELLKAIDDAKL